MYHILIAEDEYIERTVLIKNLRDALGEGYEVHGAENGRRAVELFRQYPIGVAILDIEMPVMNGIDVAQIISREAPHCGILFLTAYDSFEYAKQAIHVRTLDYLLKPYSDNELLASVENAIHRPVYYRSAQTDKAGDEEKCMDKISVITRQMEDYVRTHYQQEVSMQDAACALNYSEQYFCKLFKQQFGQNFTSYLTAYRMERARELLAQPMVNIKDVGLRVGYSDANYFAKVFRRFTGKSPSEYRMNLPET